MQNPSPVEAFIRQFIPDSDDTETWGVLPLRIRSYAVAEVPPLESISSVRCVVLSGESVLAMDNPDGWALLPGGRREADETLLETLHRELLEESGWTISDPVLLGFIHYQHLGPKPVDYRYPYPVFTQVVYTARAVTEYPDKRMDDPFEQPAHFIRVSEARTLNLRGRDRVFLEAALRHHLSG